MFHGAWSSILHRVSALLSPAVASAASGSLGCSVTDTVAHALSQKTHFPKCSHGGAPVGPKSVSGPVSASITATVLWPSPILIEIIGDTVSVMIPKIVIDAVTVFIDEQTLSGSVSGSGSFSVPGHESG